MVETFISFDIETNGSIPGPYSMLSLGAVAYDENGKEISCFYQKLTELEEAGQDPGTMDWWKRYPEAYKEAISNQIYWKDVMKMFVEWVKGLPGKSVLCAYPGSWDGMFLLWYCVQAGFTFDQLPWKHRILDIRSYAAGKIGCNYHEAQGKVLEKAVGKEPVFHDHNALNDARGQGYTITKLRGL